MLSGYELVDKEGMQWQVATIIYLFGNPKTNPD